MAILNRKDELERLVDAVLVSAATFIRSKNDLLSDAEVKRLMSRRAVRLGTQRAMRGTDPNLGTRIVISMTGNV